MIKIYDIDFSCPHDEFMDGLKDYLSNSGNCNMDASSCENATKNGRYMYKIEVTCQDDPNVTTVLFEKNPNNGDILFVPSGLKSFGGTFYKVEHLQDNIKGTDDDTSVALMNYLEVIAKKQKGKFVCCFNKTIICIVNGSTKTAKECIVDANGNVYGAKEVSSVSLLDGSSTLTSYATKLLEWNKERKAEDPDFAAILSDKSTSIQEKYNLIGKYVMMLRAKEEITADEFKDLFIQAGAADGYINDKTLNTIYKLLKN